MLPHQQCFRARDPKKTSVPQDVLCWMSQDKGRDAESSWECSLVFLGQWKWKLGRLGKLATCYWILNDYQRTLAFINLWNFNLSKRVDFKKPVLWEKADLTSTQCISKSRSVFLGRWRILRTLHDVFDLFWGRWCCVNQGETIQINDPANNSDKWPSNPSRWQNIRTVY